MQFFPATLVPKGSKIKLDGLHLAPAIFQKAIKPDVELRVTVVGAQVFAAAIRDNPVSGVPAKVRDWRVSYALGANPFEPYMLSKKVAEQCVQLVKDLGLQYGAIDLIVDKKGAVWFLEINPNGQWSFVEEDTGLPIGKAIASLLEGVGLTPDSRQAAWQLR